jgi:hypothetical protein
MDPSLALSIVTVVAAEKGCWKNENTCLYMAFVNNGDNSVHDNSERTEPPGTQHK